METRDGRTDMKRRAAERPPRPNRYKHARKPCTRQIGVREGKSNVVKQETQQCKEKKEDGRIRRRDKEETSETGRWKRARGAQSSEKWA